MFHYEPKDLTVSEVYKLLVGGVGPRPIALVSTISEDGINNLSPFSFFNTFGSNPPIIAFSPTRRRKDASHKDTYNNLMATKECVVQVVTYSIVGQVNLASTEYTSEVDEFIRSGLTPIDSDFVKPKRVKESPFQMECKLVDMKSYGEKGSSANISICEVLKFHISEEVFTNGIIDPQKIDLVSKMPGNFYCRAYGDAIFELPRPQMKQNIGYNQIPDFMKNSNVYTGNNLAAFALVENIPDKSEVDEFIKKILNENPEEIEVTEDAFFKYLEESNYLYMLKAVIHFGKVNHSQLNKFIQLTAKCALENNNKDFAWKAALYELNFHN
ncbi:flavin reductase family protein [bacterium BMS3Abin03]|nr:flavin reductase family protein [bacterium BMS3Abin03]